MEEIPYQTITKYSVDLEPGETKLVQEGSPGRQILQKEKIYYDGRLTTEQVEDRHVLKEPVDQIIEKGKENIL